MWPIFEQNSKTNSFINQKNQQQQKTVRSGQTNYFFWKSVVAAAKATGESQ